MLVGDMRRVHVNAQVPGSKETVHDTLRVEWRTDTPNYFDRTDVSGKWDLRPILCLCTGPLVTGSTYGTSCTHPRVPGTTQTWHRGVTCHTPDVDAV